MTTLLTAFDADVLIYAAQHDNALGASVAALFTALAVSYRLRTADAAHLATAVTAGAQRFLTTNRKDFSKSISEIDIVHPDEL